MSTCKRCGAAIVWATTREGARIPLQAASVRVAVPVSPGIVEMVSGQESHIAYCRPRRPRRETVALDLEGEVVTLGRRAKRLVILQVVLRARTPESLVDVRRVAAELRQRRIDLVLADRIASLQDVDADQAMACVDRNLQTPTLRGKP